MQSKIGSEDYMGKVTISKKDYEYSIWDGKEKLNDFLIAMDTETTVVDTPGVLPEIVLTTASDGKKHVIIENHLLGDFLLLHKNARFVFYNIAFDFWVIDKFLPNCRVLWDAADANRLHDYMLLDMLFRLALDDSFPAPRNLGITSKIYCNMEIDKTDPYRMIYGTILGKDLRTVEVGFLDYAIKDTIATYFGFLTLFGRAKKLAFSYGINRDVLQKYGLFTEQIQVKAAISLSKITNNGITLNTQLSREMHDGISDTIWSIVNQLDNEYPGLFKREKKKKGDDTPAGFELTDHGVPKTSRKVLAEIFTEVANRVGKSEGLKIEIPKTEKGNITTSMVVWSDYIVLDDFLTKWDIWVEQTKAKQFFKKLSVEKIHPRYNYFVRTGRTSQQDPNCVDKDTEILTDKFGWLRFEDAYNRQDEDFRVLQFNPETKCFSLVKPIGWVKSETSVWLNFKSPGTDMQLTPDHRVLTYNKDRKEYVSTTADELSDRFLIPVAGKYNVEEDDWFPLDKPHTRLLARIIKHFTKCGKYYIWQGGSSTASKMNSFQYIASLCNIKIHFHKSWSHSCVMLHENQLGIFEELCEGQIVPGPWIFKLPKNALDVLCLEFDGAKTSDPWINLIFCLCRKVKYVTGYKNKTYKLARVKRKVTFLKTPEESYCVTVPDSFFLARKNGKPFITGNCQQIKKGKMREIIVPSSGHLLVAIDYSYIELRTLAHVMEKLFKKSVMADVIREGKDPHSWTGGMLIGLEYDEFMGLKKTRPEYYAKWRQNAKACFHEDVEVLTPIGWKRISDILEKDLVAQYTKEGKVEFVHPTGTIKIENKNLYELKSRHFSLRVTDDHNMYCLDWAEKPCTCKPKDFKRKARKTVHAGYMEGAISDEIAIRQAVAIQADGSIAYSQYSFGFKKDRKIERFKELFDNVFFKEVYDEKYGVTRFTIPNDLPYSKYLNSDKTFNTEEILKLDLTSRIAFIEELFYWDGSHKTERAFSFTSVNLDVINTVQAVAATCGYRTVFNEWIPNLSPNLAYSLGITKTETARPSKMSYTLVEENTTVYCISVPSTLLIVKDKGSVQVCHNCNFGLPGGLSAPSLLNYAKNVYHIKDWTIETAKIFRDKICQEVYPELGLYLQEDTMRIMCESLGCSTEDAWSKFEINGERAFGMLNCIKNIIIGKPFKKDGTKYNEAFVERVWQDLLDLCNNPTLVPALQSKAGTLDLLKQMFWTQTRTLTGRVRGRVSFTQNKNTKFQGLAADGAKLALYRFIKEGYRVTNFVHDEIVFELPDLGNCVDRHVVEYLLGVMCEEMAGLTPGIPIAGEYSVDSCWRKDNKNMRLTADRIYIS